MLRQMLHVVMMLSTIDVVVVGITLDSGGNNARFVKYFLGQSNNVESGWLKRVWFPNVFSEVRKNIYVVLFIT